MEDLPRQVLNAFNISPKKIIKSRLSYICRCDFDKDLKSKNGKNAKVIQKSLFSEKNLIQSQEIKHILLQNGFETLDNYFASSQNTPYYKLNTDIYIMKNFVETSETDFSNSAEVKKILKKTAQMHKALANSEIPPGLCNVTATNILNDIMTKRQNLKKTKKICTNKKHLSDFDVLFIKNYTYFQDIADKAINTFMLEETKFKNYLNNEFLKHTGKFICHSSLKEETVLKLKNDYCITGFENAKSRYYLYDIADILERYIRKHARPLVSFSEFAEEYSSVNTLNETDLNLLKIIMLFPERYIKMCGEVYSKGRSFVPNFLTKKISEIIFKKEEKEKFIFERI